MMAWDEGTYAHRHLDRLASEMPCRGTFFTISGSKCFMLLVAIKKAKLCSFSKRIMLNVIFLWYHGDGVVELEAVEHNDEVNEALQYSFDFGTQLTALSSGKHRALHDERRGPWRLS